MAPARDPLAAGQTVIAQSHAQLQQLLNAGVNPMSIFPSAPTTFGNEWGGWESSDARDHAMSISPAATEAINSGRSGLY